AGGGCGLKYGRQNATRRALGLAGGPNDAVDFAVERLAGVHVEADFGLVARGDVAEIFLRERGDDGAFGFADKAHHGFSGADDEARFQLQVRYEAVGWGFHGGFFEVELGLGELGFGFVGFLSADIDRDTSLIGGGVGDAQRLVGGIEISAVLFELLIADC